MRTITKPAHPGTPGERSPLLGAFDTVRRAFGAAADRRALRPMENLDGWSTQAEVAYYETCTAARLT